MDTYLQDRQAGFPCAVCGSSWTGTSKCHCSGCHQSFSSLSSFQRHRRNLACLPPASVSLVPDPFSIWHLPGNRPVEMAERR